MSYALFRPSGRLHFRGMPFRRETNSYPAQIKTDSPHRVDYIDHGPVDPPTGRDVE